MAQKRDASPKKRFPAMKMRLLPNMSARRPTLSITTASVIWKLRSTH